MANGSNPAIISTQGERLPVRRNKDGSVMMDERGLLDLPFLVLVVLLVTIGVIMVFSSSYARAYFKEGNSTYYFARQAIFAVLGIGGMLFVSRINYQLWRSVSFIVLAVTVFFLLLVPIFGTEEGGAKRWIWIGFTSFQPSELAKVAIVLTFATLMSTYREKMQTFRYGVVPFALILLVICGLVALEKHFSCILILLTIGASMMFLGGTDLKWFGYGAIAVGVFAFLYLKFMGYASARVTAWRDPASDPAGDGYQILQSLYAIGSGGLMGLGLGRSRQKYLYLPEEHNDYIFAIVCEELGFVGAGGIILLFILLIVRGYWIAMHAATPFSTMLGVGLMTLMAVQTFLNLGVVSNLLPSTGVSLPFFSYGGTALMMQLGEMGVVLGISRFSSGTKR